MLRQVLSRPIARSVAGVPACQRTASALKPRVQSYSTSGARRGGHGGHGHGDAHHAGEVSHEMAAYQATEAAFLGGPVCDWV